jgi:hypothetical protein
VRALPTGLTSWRSLVRHDHVHTRASLIAQMVQRPSDVDQILAAAEACLVTVSEHTALGRYDATATGWDRYRMAGVDVYDFSVDPPQPFIVNGALAGP